MMQYPRMPYEGSGISVPRDAVTNKGNMTPRQAAPRFLRSQAPQTALAWLPEQMSRRRFAMPGTLVDQCLGG